MRESAILTHILKAGQGAHPPQVILGPGDDCAIVRQGVEETLLTVDQVVEGRHFERATDWAAAAGFPGSLPREAWVDLIARKAIARSVSDIAAMGGSPRWSLVSAVLAPDFPEPGAELLADRLHHWGHHFGSPVVGGDIASYSPGCWQPLVLSVTIGGTPHQRRGPVLRSGARPGDHVYVSGTLGGSLGSGRHLSFEPRLREADWLCNLYPERGSDAPLGAMMDLSDGLGRDGARIGVASNARLIIDASLLPLAPGVSDWRHAMGDGEDYELLFTLSPTARPPGPCPETGVVFTRVGVVVEAAIARGSLPSVGCLVRTEGRLIDAGELGWDHAGPQEFRP